MTLTEWAQLVCDELGLDDAVGEEDVTRILDLARDAAHSVARPAAPLTTYLLGIAVGRGAGPDAAAEALSRLALAHRQDGDGGD